MRKIPLVLRLLIGIISGIIIGLFFPEGISRLLYTFTHILTMSMVMIEHVRQNDLYLEEGQTLT
jgi:Na+/H+-dicarboxylate symporter